MLEIHLDRLRWNYLSLQKRLKKGTDCAAVVKADAYGLGAAPVVTELYKANCRHFYVAHASEGIVVRDALNSLAPHGEKGKPGGKSGDAQIYVLHGPRGVPAEEFSQAGLIPVLNTPQDIEHWAGFARKTEKRQPALLHFDTGMNRLGLAALPDKTMLQQLDIRYVMSHLACADEPDHPKNGEQLNAFKRLTAALGLPCRLSLANSAGIFLGADYHFDQARPGCALYGINPATTGQNPMQGVVTLKTRVLQTRDAGKGETVGYGASYKVSIPSKLATISAGYADGILRSFAKSGAVFIHGQRCPVVGRVSMDLLVVDVTKTVCSVNDWAEIVGEHQSVDAVAAAAGTIGYEILTALGHRYKRAYLGQEE